MSLFLMASVSTQGQSRKDSLWAVWHDPTVPDNLKTQALVRLAWVEYIEKNQADSGIIIAKMAYDLAKSMDDKNQMTNALIQMSNGYRNKGDYPRELNSLMKGYEIAIEAGDSLRVAQSAHSMYLIYSGMGDEETAKEYLEQSLTYTLALEHDIGIGYAYSALSGFAHQEQNYREVIRLSILAVTYLERTDIDFKTFQSMSTISVTNSEIGQPEEALRWLDRMEEFMEKRQLKHWKDAYRLAGAYGIYYRSTGQYKKAIEYLQKCFQLSEEHLLQGAHERYQSSQELSKIYALIQDFEKAYQYKLKSETFKDKLDDPNKELANIKKVYASEFARVALQDSLEFVQQQAAAELQYETNLARRNYFLFGGLGIALLLIIFFRYRQRIEVERKETEARRLQELDQLKTRLYTNITHEFRTPLTVIQGMARKVIEKPDKWLQQGTGMIERNSEQLLHLVNQMLDLSKLESGNIKLQPVQADIIPFIYYVAEPFQAMAEAKGISLHMYQEIDELTMDFDPDRLTEIISNLLSNAIKFTPEGGQIDIQTLCDKDSFLLIVKDSGIGIPADKLPHIFDRFYQADDSPTRSNEGTGIGLALSKELVQLMDGRIQVSSQVGKGTEFTIILPISQQAMVSDLPLVSMEHGEDMLSALPTILSESNPLSDDLPHILLIEDNPDVVSYLSSCLEANYRISIARDGQEGIDKALELVPDLIISDVMMPEKDGFEVCYTLKQDIRTSHVPIIMLTAKADVDSKLTGLRRGADAYLSKPFNEEELLIRIHNLLEVRTTLHNRYRGDLESLDSAPTAEIEKEDVFIQEVRQVVMAQLSNYQLDVPTLCKELGMARTPLHNKLKALTGMSTTEYVRFVRLSHAQELLRDTDMHVSEIAYATGFQNHTYFSRKFRSLFGESPKEWREGI